MKKKSKRSVPPVQKPPEPAPMLQVGASYRTVAETRLAINDILAAAHVDNNTKVEALKALTGVCSVNGMTISGCNFSGGYTQSGSGIR